MHVLLHPAQGKLGLVVAALGFLSLRREKRRHRGRAEQGIEQRLLREPEPFTQSHGFGECRHGIAQQQIDHHFHGSSHPLSAGVNNFVAHAEQERANSFQISAVGPNPENKFCVPATGAEPVTGASTKRTSRRAASAAIFLENDGLTELQSTQSAFGLRLPRKPLRPSAACSTASGCASIVNKMSTCSATFAGESENVPQGPSNGSALARVRLNTTNAWPCFCKFAAIRLPIMPRPIKPIFIFVFFVKLPRLTPV